MNAWRPLRRLAGLLALLGFLFSATATGLPAGVGGLLDATLCTSSDGPPLDGPGGQECCGACILADLAHAPPPNAPALAVPLVAAAACGLPADRLAAAASGRVFQPRAPPLA